MGGKIRIELGRRSINIMFVDRKVNLKIFPKKFYINARREFELLQKLSKEEINVPKPVAIIDAGSSIILAREYIKGVYFHDAIRHYPPEELKKLILNLIKNLRKIEDMGIFIPEFSTLYKNVVVDGCEPYILDLERGGYSGKPIIPQFLGLLIRLCNNNKLKEKLAEIMEIEKLKDAARRYKETRDLEVVLDLFKSMD